MKRRHLTSVHPSNLFFYFNGFLLSKQRIYIVYLRNDIRENCEIDNHFDQGLPKLKFTVGTYASNVGMFEKMNCFKAIIFLNGHQHKNGCSDLICAHV